MYAAMVYKDKMIIELNNKILDSDRRLIDIQEFVNEKEEVINSRNKAIRVLKCYYRNYSNISTPLEFRPLSLYKNHNYFFALLNFDHANLKKT